eukprot:2874777-Rhodomonas_salina.3
MQQSADAGLQSFAVGQSQKGKDDRESPVIQISSVHEKFRHQPEGQKLLDEVVKVCALRRGREGTGGREEAEVRS